MSPFGLGEKGMFVEDFLCRTSDAIEIIGWDELVLEEPTHLRLLEKPTFVASESHGPRAVVVRYLTSLVHFRQMGLVAEPSALPAMVFLYDHCLDIQSRFRWLVHPIWIFDVQMRPSSRQFCQICRSRSN